MYARSSKKVMKTLKEIMDEKQPERKVDNPVEVLPEWAVFKPYVPVADMSVKESHDKLIPSHQAFVDLVALKPPGANTTWRHNQPNILIQPSKELRSILLEWWRKAKDQKKFESAIKHSWNIICTNGGLRGVVTRLYNGMPKVRPYVKPKESLMDFLGEHTVLSFDELPDKIDWKETLEFMQINPKSDAGFPFVLTDPNAKSDGQNVLKAVELAKKYCNMLEDDNENLTKTLQYFREHPEESYFMLKRKSERITRLKYEVKIRPYFVPPLALKILFKTVTDIISDSLLNYQEDPDSVSAYKTSWFYGGADKLMKHLFASPIAKSQESEEFIMTSVCYGDDSIFSFVYPDGSFVALAPDVNHMDMTNSSDFGVILRTLCRQYYASKHGKDPPKWFTQILAYLTSKAFATDCHMFGPYCMLIQWSLKSGVPLTTILDIICSTYIHGVVRQVAENTIGSCSGIGDPTFSKNKESFLKIIQKRCEEEVSITFKEGTLEMFECKNYEELTEFPLPFLGFKMVYDGFMFSSAKGDVMVEGWLPIPADMNDRISSFVTPARRVGGDNEYSYTMERIYGLVLAGVWYDVDFYEMFKEVYDKYYEKGYRPDQLSDMPDVLEDGEELVSLHPRLPSIQEVKVMYLLPKEKYADLVISSVIPESPPAKEQPSPIPALGGSVHKESELNAFLGVMRINSKYAGKVMPKPTPVVTPLKIKPEPIKIKSLTDVKRGGKKKGKATQAAGTKYMKALTPE
jgi:hypothetical protein